MIFIIYLWIDKISVQPHISLRTQHFDQRKLWRKLYIALVARLCFLLVWGYTNLYMYFSIYLYFLFLFGIFTVYIHLKSTTDETGQNTYSIFFMSSSSVKVEKDVFRLVTSVGQRKKFWVPMRRSWELRIFVPRSWQDEKHFSRFLYRTQNLPSLLFYLRTLKLYEYICI